MAGLLARGSQLRLAFPTFRSVARQASLTAYSCGGSHGLGPFWVRLTVFPFHLPRCRAEETIGADAMRPAAQLQARLCGNFCGCQNFWQMKYFNWPVTR